MRWDEKDVYFTWIEGSGWVRYPVRMPVWRPVAWDSTPAWDHDIYDGLVTVWCGPRAMLPAHPYAHQIIAPRQMVSRVPHEDLQFPQWKTFHASKVIAPDRGYAWAYEVGPREPDGWHSVIWKVWDHVNVQ